MSIPVIHVGTGEMDTVVGPQSLWAHCELNSISYFVPKCLTLQGDRSDMGLVILDIQEVKVVRGWNNPDGIMKCLDSGSGKEGTWLRDF